MKSSPTMLSALLLLNVYRLGYLLIFLGRITTATPFPMSIPFRRGGLGKAMVPIIISPASEASKSP